MTSLPSLRRTTPATAAAVLTMVPTLRTMVPAVTQPYGCTVKYKK